MANEIRERLERAINDLQKRLDDMKRSGQEAGQDMRNGLERRLQQMRDMLNEMRDAGEEGMDQFRDRVDELINSGDGMGNPDDMSGGGMTRGQ